MLGLIVLLSALQIAVSGPPSSPEYLPIRVAETEGYFTREGLAVTLSTTRAESGAAEALAQGQAQLAATSLEALLRFGTRPTQRVPRIVFALTAAPPVALVAATTPHAPPSIGALAGTRIGMTAPGAPEHAWLIAVLRRAGVERAHVDIVSLGARGLAVGLQSGDVDAGIVPAALANRLVDDGHARLLADLRSPAAAAAVLGGATVNVALFERPDHALEDATLAALTRALTSAIRRIRTAPPAELAERLDRRVVGAPDEFEARVRATAEAFLPDGLTTSDAVQRSLAAIVEHAPLPWRLKLPKPAELLRLDPARRALSAR